MGRDVMAGAPTPLGLFLYKIIGTLGPQILYSLSWAYLRPGYVLQDRAGALLMKAAVVPPPRSPLATQLAGLTQAQEPGFF